MSGLPADRNAPFAGWTPELIDQASAEYEARAHELDKERQAAYAEGRKDEAEENGTASRLIGAWVASHGKPIPWDKAVEIVAIVNKLPEAERLRLLALND